MSTKKKFGAYLEGNLIHSEAYLSLRGISPQLLPLFLSRCKKGKTGKKGHEKWVIWNNGEIVFTYAEAKNRFGWSQKQFSRGLKELHSKGFIDVAYHGGCYRQDRSKYAISDRWRKYGTRAFEHREWPEDKVQRGFRKPRKAENHGHEDDLPTSLEGTHTHVPEGQSKARLKAI